MRTRTVLILIATLFVQEAGARAQKPTTLPPADYIEIQQLYARYNMALDSTDAKLLETVWTADGEFFAGNARRKGREMRSAAEAKSERPLVRHMATSITITPSPEGARGTSYLMLVNLQATPPALVGGGFYEDVIVKTPEGWRFKTRRFYSQITPTAPAASAAPGAQPPQSPSR